MVLLSQNYGIEGQCSSILKAEEEKKQSQEVVYSNVIVPVFYLKNDIWEFFQSLKTFNVIFFFLLKLSKSLLNLKTPGKLTLIGSLWENLLKHTAAMFFFLSKHKVLKCVFWHNTKFLIEWRFSSSKIQVFQILLVSLELLKFTF